MSETYLEVEVAWALPDQQVIVPLRVPAGTTAAAAVRRVEERIPAGLGIEDLGVFGRRVKAEHVLVDGDRVELYRPLKADPKDIRRELARIAAARD